jgi:hypothetical protein
MDKPIRSCGSCTKCCEGYLSGKALGHTFYAGKPCHFIVIGTGCTVYEKRPKDPCVSYKCAWLTSEDIPAWMKPSDIDAIIDMRQIEGHSYLSIKEAGSPLQAQVLSWFFQYILKTGMNAVWEVNGGMSWVGNPEFVSAMESKNLNSNNHYAVTATATASASTTT